MDWPFVRRSKLDEMRLRLIAEKARNADLAIALAQAQVELRKHRMLLASQSIPIEGSVK